MGLTIIRSGVIEDGSITSANIDNATIVSGDIDSSTITNAKMAVDPSSATNLNTGDVPAARLQNRPEPDTTGLQDDIALLAFKTQANGSLARYNLVDQFSDAFEDASGVDAGSSTNAIRDSSGKYYSGSEDTAGTASFNMTAADQTWTVSAGAAAASPVFIKCFGAGTASKGGFSTGYLAVTESTQYTIVVGQLYPNPGGISGHKPAGYGGGGQGWGWDSGGGLSGVFTGTDAFSATSTTVQSRAVIIGGGSHSRGGTGQNPAIPQAGAGGGTSGQDGTRLIQHTPNYQTSGTGGTQSAAGAGGPGGSVMLGGNAAGGPSQEIGAGGGGYFGGGGGYGYQGGGGGGSSYIGTQNSLTSGATYIGSSSTKTNDADWIAEGLAASKQGFVKMSWGAQSYNNMTLESNTVTAVTAPTKGDIVMTYTNAAGTAGINTDITAEFSADGGSTWTAMTLASQGTTGGHTILTAHDVTRTSTSGTNMRWRIKTTDQSVSKQTRIQAVALGWS